MPKVSIEFNLPEEKVEMNHALKGSDLKFLMDEVHERLFRPAYKHGYQNEELEKLSNTKTGQRVIELLSEMFQNLKEEYEVNNLD